MNSLIVLIAAVACLAQSYAGVIHGVYGHGGLYAGVGHGVAVAAPLAVAPIAVASPVAAGGTYHGPLARPVVLPSGFLADTPEVAAVKGAHLTALATTSAVAAATGAGAYGAGAYGAGAGAGAGAGSHNDGSDDHLWAADGSYRTVGAGANGAGAYGAGAYGAGAYGAGAYGAGAYGAGAAAGGRYAGPLAAPVVLPSGFLADTHAVVAARGAHLTAVANSAHAAAPAAYAGAYGAYGAGHYGHGYHH